MKIYLSGQMSSHPKTEIKWLKESGCQYRCFTYYYMCKSAPGWKESYYDTFLANLDAGQGIMLDSGAHTVQHWLVHTSRKMNLQSKVPDLLNRMFDSYIEFCLKWKDKLDFYVTFDYSPTAKLTWEASERMFQAGLRPCVVFHGDDSITWLDKYVERGYDYIGISGVTTARARGRRRERFSYLDSCFRQLSRGESKPQVKTHGFAVTAFNLMGAYPWTSVDSSTWMKAAVYGKVLIPSDHSTSVRMIRISTRGAGEDSYWHYGAHQKKILDQLFKSCHTTAEELGSEKEDGQIARKLFNARIFANWRQTTDEFKPRFERLF